VQDRQVRVGLHEQSTGDVVDGLTGFLAFDHAQPLALEFRHGCRRADDVEAVMYEPDEVIEVTGPVLRCCEPVSNFLHDYRVNISPRHVEVSNIGPKWCKRRWQLSNLLTNSCCAVNTFGRPFFLFISVGM